MKHLTNGNVLVSDTEETSGKYKDKRKNYYLPFWYQQLDAAPPMVYIITSVCIIQNCTNKGFLVFLLKVSYNMHCLIHDAWCMTYYQVVQPSENLIYLFSSSNKKHTSNKRLTNVMLYNTMILWPTLGLLALGACTWSIHIQ